MVRFQYSSDGQNSTCQQRAMQADKGSISVSAVSRTWPGFSIQIENYSLTRKGSIQLLEDHLKSFMDYVSKKKNFMYKR
ncbi:hypothetical protein TNCV_2994851 [Trichonephila clavipes]|nr:hypothetical protein TNCV_2994851 [Trichonephila clavipes]